MKFRFKRAFTIAEATITLFMLSVLVAITIPAITNIAPSSSKVGVRNAYNIISTNIDTLINNPTLYPPEKVIDEVNIPIPQGFFYTDTGIKSSAIENDSETNNLAWEYEAYTRQCMCNNGGKLVRLFCCSLNVSTASCNTNSCYITTNNGMTWTITQNTLATTANRSTTPYLYVDVDINGYSSPNNASAPEPDRYKFNVFYNGRIEIDTTASTKGKIYLESPMDTKKKE